jgi:hypothetical protein
MPQKSPCLECNEISRKSRTETHHTYTQLKYTTQLVTSNAPIQIEEHVPRFPISKILTSMTTMSSKKSNN